MPTAYGDEIYPDSMEEEFDMLVAETAFESKTMRALQQLARALGEDDVVDAITDIVMNVCSGAHDFDPSDVCDALPAFTTDQALAYLSRRIAKLEGKQ